MSIILSCDKLEKISNRKLSDIEIDENVQKFASDYSIKNLGKYIAKASGVAAASKAIIDQSSIDQYIKEHPNTRLSKKEILKRVKEGKV